MSHLTVMTYNIHVGVGVDGRLDLGRIARVITSGQASVVGLQEVDRNTARSGGVDQAAVLTELTGMEHVYGPAYAYQGGFFGPAVLSRLPILRQECIALPHKEENEGRLVVMVQVPWNGTTLTILNTHLEHADGADRAVQGERLGEIAAKHAATGPTIVMGDLNAQPHDHSVLAGLRRHVRDTYDLALERSSHAGADAALRIGNGFTFDSVTPRMRIDYVWVSSHFELADVPNPFEILQSDASDHLPLIVHLKLVK